MAAAIYAGERLNLPKFAPQRGEAPTVIRAKKGKQRPRKQGRNWTAAALKMGRKWTKRGSGEPKPARMAPAPTANTIGAAFDGVALS